MKAESKPKHYISALCFHISWKPPAVAAENYCKFSYENKFVAINALCMLKGSFMIGAIRILKKSIIINGNLSTYAFQAQLP